MASLCRPRLTAALVGAFASGLLTSCADQPEQQLVFCYRNLAAITCHTEPRPGGEQQLVGVYLRDPNDPANKDYWLQRAAAPMSR